jgi:hypothetical protein
MEAVQSAAGAISADKDRTMAAVEKLATLDESVKWLDARIGEMNQARESAARLATELRELDELARSQLNMARAVMKDSSGRAAKALPDDGAPAPRDQDNIRRLKRQGWTIDDISRAFEISKGEVELILQLGPKDV